MAGNDLGTHRCSSTEPTGSSAPSVEGLIARLEATSEGSWELDYDILRAAHQSLQFRIEPAVPALLMNARVMAATESGADEHVELTPYTRSLDAALTLVTPPHWLQHLGHDLRGWNCRVEQQGISEGAKGVPTPALALCIAALKARAASSPNVG